MTTMATKAQRFRAQAQRRARPPRPPRPPRPRRDQPVDTSLPGVSATDRKAGGGSTAGRNASARAGRKGGARLEDSATGKPSRTSTRKSAGRSKRTTNLQQRAQRATSAPSRQATRDRARRR
jgi:hypothetical protein